jgi:hypothetical protein
VEAEAGEEETGEETNLIADALAPESEQLGVSLCQLYCCPIKAIWTSGRAAAAS